MTRQGKSLLRITITGWGPIATGGFPPGGSRQALRLASHNESCQPCEMPFVLTVDQRASRSSPDRVAEVLRRLNAAVPTVLAFERTAGDEFQGVLADPDDVVDVVLAAGPGRRAGASAWARDRCRPRCRPSTRAGAGPAFLSARRAVDAAKQRPARLAVRGAVPADAGDAQAVLSALAVVVERRSDQAWEAIAPGRRGPDTGRRRRANSASPGRRWASGSPPVCGTSSATCARQPPVARAGGRMSPAMNTAVLVLLGAHRRPRACCSPPAGSGCGRPGAPLFLAVLLAARRGARLGGGDAPAGLPWRPPRRGRARRRAGRRARRHRRPRAPPTPAAVGVAGGPQDPAILRGGAWIGVLERAAIAATLLVGLGRGPGRRRSRSRASAGTPSCGAPAAAERFIIGTLASGLWAAACVGVAMLLRALTASPVRGGRVRPPAFARVERRERTSRPDPGGTREPGRRPAPALARGTRRRDRRRAARTRRSSRSSTSTPTSTSRSTRRRRSTSRSPPTPTWPRRSTPPSAPTCSPRARPPRRSPTRAC